MAKEIFISYSRKDFDKVKAIKDEIDREVGIDCWMDLDGIESGDLYQNAIIKAINEHDTMLFMLSPNSMNSKYALRELNYAEYKEKRIILVYVEPCKMEDRFVFRYDEADTIDWNNPLQHNKLMGDLRKWFPSSTRREEAIQSVAEKPGARIFISYKRADKDKVFPLKDQIEAAIGEPCWIDLDGIESDAQFAEKIMRSIDAAEIFLFMYSVNHSRIKNYTTDWTVRELNYALKKEKRIVFVNIDGTKIIDWLDFMFPQQQQVDATNPDSLRHLLRDLRTWLRVKPQDTPHHQSVQPQPVSSPHIVRVYGYKEWYLIRPAVAVYRNGEKIGKLAYDSYMDIECISERDILHFRYGLNSCQFVVDPSFTGALQLVTNRFTSTISVEVI